MFGSDVKALERLSGLRLLGGYMSPGEQLLGNCNFLYSFV